MWYLNLKNWLIIILLVIGIVASGLFLWQRITVVNQKNTIGDLQVLNADLEAQIKDYKANLAVLKKIQKEQQKITNDAATLMAAVSKIKETKCIGEKDEKTISDITYFFNSRGLLDAGGTKTSGEVLPAADPSGVTGWTVKQIVQNYLILIDYVLKYERNVETCYEGKN
jgi:hypothetical protein